MSDLEQFTSSFEELGRRVSVIRDRVVQLADQDREFKSAIQKLANVVLEHLVVSAVGHTAGSESTAIAAHGEVQATVLSTNAEGAMRVAEDGVQSQSAYIVNAGSPPGHNRSVPAKDSDLPLIEQRCQLKAKASRWAIEKSLRLAGGAKYSELAPGDQELIHQAKDIGNCLLWMIAGQWQMPKDTSLFHSLAECFDATANAVSVVRKVLASSSSGDVLFEATQLLAKAQSALNVAVRRIKGKADFDQALVFDWLQAVAHAHTFKIHRFMRNDDAANPDDLDELATNTSALLERLVKSEQIEKQRKGLFGKLRYSVNQLSKVASDSKPVWQTIASIVDELVATGLLVSNTQIREVLLPVVDDISATDSFPASFELVLREIDKFLASRPLTDDMPKTFERTPEVTQVRKLLKNKTVVLIGGQMRPHARASLISAFDLADLNWIATKEHESPRRFRAAVSRPEVTLVLLAIRWASHSFGEVKEFCDEADKPFVRLLAGYSPNQVAVQILDQCSDRLIGDPH